MDGVLLVGGLATRLGPITRVTNKHLLPVYDRPIISYGIETLRDLGCNRIIIILGGNSVGDIVNLVKDGRQYNVEIIYKYQNEPKGISHAIALVEDVVDSENFLVLLGDNIFANTLRLSHSVRTWLNRNGMSYGGWSAAKSFAVFLHMASNSSEYGQPILINEGKDIERFVEKDRSVDHNLIVTGLYGLTKEVFDIIRSQKPSKRGEYEITDTLTAKLPNVQWFEYDGFWSDCGSPLGLVAASTHMAGRDEE